MAEYLIQDTTLDAIADAINAKTGGSSAMTPAEMVTAIGSISGGGGAGDYELVDTYTVAEPVSQISITIPEWATGAIILCSTQDSASNKPTLYHTSIAASRILAQLNTTQNHTCRLIIAWIEKDGNNIGAAGSSAWFSGDPNGATAGTGNAISYGKPSNVLYLAGSSAAFTGTFTLYARR